MITLRLQDADKDADFFIHCPAKVGAARTALASKEAMMGRKHAFHVTIDHLSRKSLNKIQAVIQYARKNHKAIVGQIDRADQSVRGYADIDDGRVTEDETGLAITFALAIVPD